jgi:large conductance mechanosensitive channel
MLKEFRDFAMRGNVVDLAIGVIIGAAFGKIVDSLVNDIIMPCIGALGGADFSNYFFGLSHAVNATNLVDAKKQGPVFAYGNFATIVVNFLIIAFVLFLVIQGINRMKKKEVAAPADPPPPPRSEVLLTEIRDALVKR